MEFLETMKRENLVHGGCVLSAWAAIRRITSDAKINYMSVSTHDWSSWCLQPMRTSKHQDFNQSRLDHNHEILLRKPSVTVRLASGTWMYPSFEEPYGCNFCFWLGSAGWGTCQHHGCSSSWRNHGGSVLGISTRCLAFQWVHEIFNEKPWENQWFHLWKQHY